MDPSNYKVYFIILPDFTSHLLAYISGETDEFTRCNPTDRSLNAAQTKMAAPISHYKNNVIIIVAYIFYIGLLIQTGNLSGSQWIFL